MHEVVTILAQYFIVFPVLGLAYVFLRAEASERRQLAILLVSSVVATALVTKLAASLHSDPRPFVRDGVTPYFSHASDNGFPSGHTAYSAVIAWVVFNRNRKLGIALLALALVIGSARVIAGVHHGVDIVAGFVAATIGFWAATYILRLIQAKRREPTNETK
jgi:membrane-associated phospholipid phosphatase